MVFQEPMNALSMVHKIGDQLTEAMIIHEGINKKTAESRAIKLLSDVGIPNSENNLIEKLNWSDPTELLPALIIIVMIPLTFSIANGIALGFIAYVAIKISTGDARTISSGAWFLTVVFLSKFIFL